MPAANLTELFDFEGNFTRAGRGIIEALGIKVYIEGDDENLPQEYGAFRFDVGGAVENQFAQLAKPASWPAGVAAPQEYRIYTATIEFRMKVPRDEQQPRGTGARSRLAEVRAKVREAMMKCVRPFNEVNLPLYKVDRIRPSATETGPGDAQGNTDVTVLRYELTFEIRPTAWPAWVEA